MAIATVNPATEQTVTTYSPHAPELVEIKLKLAVDAFLRHRETSFAERAKIVNKAADLLENRAAEYAELMALEMGKPIHGGIAEAKKCAAACRYYANNSEAFLADQSVDVGEDKAYITYAPLGPILAVMPWNFPFWQVIRFAAPALMAGNVGILKHASNVPQCALAIEELFLQAGFVPGVFQTLLLENREVQPLISDPRIMAVTLTGSNAAGSAVASQAGKHAKKTLLELGGSDPFIVLSSANLEQAARSAVTARIVNNGQSCIAAKRFIVEQSVYASFEEKMAEQMRSLVVGPPLEARTQVGPLASRQIVVELRKQVERSIAMGARCVAVAQVPSGPGFYFPPTLLADVPHNCPVAVEETFGPVAALFKVSGAKQAIELANRSEFGLGSSVWSNDPEEIAACIAGLDTGGVFVNQMVASDPRLPFGGVKASGYGRELGELGIREFVNAKTVRITRQG